VNEALYNEIGASRTILTASGKTIINLEENKGYVMPLSGADFKFWPRIFRSSLLTNSEVKTFLVDTGRIDRENPFAGRNFCESEAADFKFLAQLTGDVRLKLDKLPSEEKRAQVKELRIIRRLIARQFPEEFSIKR
jgi:hypothetical protein